MRIYAVDDFGQRFLRYIKCERCDATIEPRKDIADNGWMKRGYDSGPGTDKTEIDLCPMHGGE